MEHTPNFAPGLEQVTYFRLPRDSGGKVQSGLPGDVFRNVLRWWPPERTSGALAVGVVTIRELLLGKSVSRESLIELHGYAIRSLAYFQDRVGEDQTKLVGAVIDFNALLSELVGDVVDFNKLRSQIYPDFLQAVDENDPWGLAPEVALPDSWLPEAEQS